MRRAAAALAASILAVGPPAAGAAAAPRTTTAPAPSAQVNLADIESEVMCVTCKIPLNVAEGQQPTRQREFIRALIARGLDEQQIKAELVAEYGPNVLALPDDGGFGLTAYAVPIALGALLLAGLGLIVPRWRRRAAGAPPAAAAALSDADATRLDADLRRYDG